MRKPFLWISIVFLVLALMASLFMNLIFGSVLITEWTGMPLPHEKLFEEKWVQGDAHSKKKVALVTLKGVISLAEPGFVGESMVDDVIEQLKQAERDSRIAAVIVWIDSPGGEVTASDLLFHQIQKLDQKKPVIAYLNSVAASGGYYAAVGARYIMAHELCMTASIGVLLQTINYEKLSNIIGVQTLTFKSGKMKDLLNPSRPPTEEEKAYVQDMIMETYDQFVGIVAERRKLDEAKLRQGIADGRVLSGKKALAEGLVDANGYLNDAFNKACELAQIDSNSALIRYEAPLHFGKFLRIFGKAGTEPKVQVKLGPDSVHLEAGKLYYISNHLFR